MYPIFLFHSYESGLLQLNINFYDKNETSRNEINNSIPQETLLLAAQKTIRNEKEKDYNLKYKLDKDLIIDIAKTLKETLNQERPPREPLINLPEKGIYLQIECNAKNFPPGEFDYLYTADEKTQRR